MGKYDDFIKLSYCIFKIHKLSIKFFCEKQLRKGSEVSIQKAILILNEPASSQEALNGTWKIINVMAYFFSNNVIL